MDITNYQCSGCSYQSHCYIILKHHIKVSHESGNSANLNEAFENDTKLCSCEDCKYENELRAALSGYFQTHQKSETEGQGDGIINFVDVGETFEVSSVDGQNGEFEDGAREISAANFLEEEIRIEVIDSDQDDKCEGVDGEVVFLQEDSGESENNNLTNAGGKAVGTKSLGVRKILNEHGNIEVHVVEETVQQIESGDNNW